VSLLSSVFRELSGRFHKWNRPKSAGKSRVKRFKNKLNFTAQIKSRPLRWLIVLLLWFFGLMFLYSLGLKYIENYDWSEAIWQGWQTFTTVGYGNAPPQTVLGRAYTIVLSTIGIAIVGAVFSAAFDYSHFLSELKRSGFMKNPHKNGYVIFNFPDTHQLSSFIQELRTVEPEVGICLVDSRLEELPKSIASLHHIHFIKGSTLDENTYQRANLIQNKAVIVFPHNPTLGDSDGATKTTVDLIEQFTGETTRIIHILVDPKNAWMFAKNRSTSILESFELFAIIQECQDPYSARIVEALLLNTEGANPKTLKPNHIIGWNWGEFLEYSLKVCQQTEITCTPFAMVKKGEPLTCPNMLELITKDSFLSVIAFNDFNWEDFEQQLLTYKLNLSR